MFKYKTKDKNQKGKLEEQLPKLESIVDQLMFQRLRWDIHFYTPPAKEKILEESKSIQQPEKKSVRQVRGSIKRQLCLFIDGIPQIDQINQEAL